jgi:uncharacterized protein (TIRG00374 family)
LKRRRFLLGVAVGLFLLLLVLLKVDLRTTVVTLRSASYGYLVPAALFLMLFLVIKAVRWSYLLGSALRASPGAIFSAVLVGYFGNQVLIANSGELLRALVLGQREDLSKSAILGTIVVEKIMDVSVLCFSLLLLLWLMPLPSWVGEVGLVTTLLLALGLAIVVLLLYRGWKATHLLTSLLDRLSPVWAQGITRLINSFVDGLRALERRGEAAIAFLLGFPMWALLVISFYFVGLGVRITLPPQAYTLPMILVALGAFILTPGGMGTLEFFGTASLAILSVDSGQALAFVILVRAVRLLPMLLGYFLFSKEGFGLRSLGREAYDTNPQE